jgi:hypothetical protein
MIIYTAIAVLQIINMILAICLYIKVKEFLHGKKRIGYEEVFKKGTGKGLEAAFSISSRQRIKELEEENKRSKTCDECRQRAGKSTSEL